MAQFEVNPSVKDRWNEAGFRTVGRVMGWVEDTECHLYLLQGQMPRQVEPSMP